MLSNKIGFDASNRESMKDKVKKGIAWLLSFLFSGIGVQYIPKISFDSLDVNGKVPFFLSPRFSVLDVLLFIIVAVGLYFLLNFLFIRHRITKEERMENELRRFNRMAFNDGDILAEWSSTLDFSGKKGIAGDFQLYCNHHNPPQRMSMGVCPIDGCKYHIRGISEHNAKEQVESALDQEIRRLKIKYKID